MPGSGACRTGLKTTVIDECIDIFFKVSVFHVLARYSLL